MSYRPVQHDPRACLHCGKSYTPRRSDGMYCCSSCCSQANYLVNPRNKKGTPQPEAPQPPEVKEVGFGKLAAAAAVGQVALEVIENIAGVGSAAQINRIEKQNHRLEKQNQEILLKLDGLTFETKYEIEDSYYLGTLSNSIPNLILLPADQSTPLQAQVLHKGTSNSFSKYGPQFDPKDIVM